MKVKLIQMTENPIDVMWTAARTCYASESPIDMWDKAYETYIDPDNVLTDACEKQEKAHWKLVQKVLNSGHQSIAEHVYFTFAIEGISRACSHQFVRHRAGIVFSQQSQRYCKPKDTQNLEQILVYYKKSQWDLLQEKFNMTQEQTEEYILNVLHKYFVIPDKLKVDSELQSLEGNVKSLLKTNLLTSFFDYIHFLNMGMESEDARNVLPNSTKTNITMSVNYRELIHLCNLRLCTRAQKEIRDLFKLIVKEVKNVDEKLASYLVPQCEVLGLCTEHQCCGRKPKLSDIMKGYEEYNYYKNNITPCEFDTLSEDDYNMLMEAIKNPKVNQKLVEFMKQPNILD